jgi:hypothetical protein
MLDVGASLRISSWSRWVFSWEVMRRVAMLLWSAPGWMLGDSREMDDGEGLRRRWSGGTVAC